LAAGGRGGVPFFFNFIFFLVSGVFGVGCSATSHTHHRISGANYGLARAPWKVF
jgi:hypothetical protein